MPFLTSVEKAFGQGTPQTNIVEFIYPNLSSTAGLTLVSTYGVVGNLLQLTAAVNGVVGNVYRSTAIRYNRNFSFQFNFECSGGSSPPADGFSLNWTTTNNTNGVAGGGCGQLTSSLHSFLFQTYTNNAFLWYKNNVLQSTTTGQNFYRNLYYWFDQNHAASTINIQYSTTNTKPASANFTLTGFSFDSTNYQIGFGAATGGANEAHILCSMSLTFT